MAGKRLEKKKKMKTSDRILILLGAFLLAFILSMMITFWVKESVPDTLIQYTLGAGGVETVVLAGIKISTVSIHGLSRETFRVRGQCMTVDQ